MRMELRQRRIEIRPGLSPCLRRAPDNPFPAASCIFFAAEEIASAFITALGAYRRYSGPYTTTIKLPGNFVPLPPGAAGGPNLAVER